VQTLGLDLGSHGFKAVLIRHGLKGTEWVKAWSAPAAPLPEAPPTGDLPWFDPPTDEKPIRGLLNGNPAADQVVVSVPMQACSIRRITVPFEDAKRIAQVVPFELEGLIPLPIEEMAVDYAVLDQAKGKTTVLAVAVARHYLVRLADVLGRAGLDPSRIELDVLALAQTAVEAAGSEASDRMILDFGGSRTNLCILRSDVPKTLPGVGMVRTILKGGGEITSALRTRLGLSEAEAERRKCEIGLSGIEGAGSDGLETARVVREAIGPLMDEIHRTVQVYQAETQREVGTCLVCGGGARLKGLTRLLSDRLGCSVEPLRPGRMSGPIPAGWDEVYATGLGLALRGTRTAGFSALTRSVHLPDFRTQVASPMERQPGRLRRRWMAFAAAAAVILLGAGDLTLKYHLKDRQHRHLKDELRAAFMEQFPQTSRVVDEIQQTQSAIEDLQKKMDLLGAGTMSTLSLLDELSGRMPRGVTTEIQDLVIEEGRIRMEAEVESFDAIDQIKSALASYDRLTEVTVSDAKKTADQKRVRFRLTAGLTKTVNPS
jgi:general secretion pathway protein L